MKTQILISTLLLINATFSYKLASIHVTKPTSSLVSISKMDERDYSYASNSVKKPYQIQNTTACTDIENTFASLGLKKPPQMQNISAGTNIEDTFASLGLKKPPQMQNISAGTNIEDTFASLGSKKPPQVIYT